MVDLKGEVVENCECYPDVLEWCPSGRETCLAFGMPPASVLLAEANRSVVVLGPMHGLERSTSGVWVPIASWPVARYWTRTLSLFEKYMCVCHLHICL